MISNEGLGTTFILDLDEDGLGDFLIRANEARWEPINGARVLTDPADDGRLALLCPGQEIGPDLDGLIWARDEVGTFSFDAARAKGEEDPFGGPGSFAGLYTIGLSISSQEGRLYGWVRFTYSRFFFQPGSQLKPTSLGILFDYGVSLEGDRPIQSPLQPDGRGNFPGQVMIEWTAAPGASYQLERAFDVGSNGFNWSAFGDAIAAVKTDMAVLIPINDGFASEFYRVISVTDVEE
ncbi:MAG: hypothetical protein HC841_08550 [Verrucomicrobiae bacterium]|nr:hypothetical protein [Verrucomicrobiae bacterium]